MHMRPVLRIAVASPSDVADERNAVRQIIDEFNHGRGRDLNIFCELWCWETDVYPQFHPKGPQDAIEETLRIEQCELIIGIFWKRFGTPVPDAASGTEREILKAYNAWKVNKRPQIMLYFNQKVDRLQARLEEIDQFRKILLLKDRFKHDGLYQDYTGLQDFISLFRRYLDQFIDTFCKTDSSWSLGISTALLKANKQSADRSEMARKIVLASADEDEVKVRKLYEDLRARGLEPLPNSEGVEKTLQEAKLFLACISNRSFENQEFRRALAAFGDREPGSIYLLAVRLEDCDIPDLKIPNRSLRLSDFRAANLGRKGGLDELVDEIKHVLGVPTPPQTSQQKAPPPNSHSQSEMHNSRVAQLLKDHEIFFDPDFPVGTITRGDGKEDVNGKFPTMVIIPSGSFWMGSPMSELNRDHDEGPQHRVKISRSAIGRYPVMFKEYEIFAEATERELPDNEGWGDGCRPVINVTWEDAKAYTEWVSAQTGGPYRLLSEAEWEYACRAGTTTRYSWGNNIGPYNANWAGSLIKMTTEVGSYEANPWGVYDMYGNVREWLEDIWHESYEGAPADGSAWTWPSEVELRVIRGGAWDDGSRILRSTCRSGRPQREYRCNFIGFRIAMSLS